MFYCVQRGCEQLQLLQAPERTWELGCAVSGVKVLLQELVGHKKKKKKLKEESGWQEGHVHGELGGVAAVGRPRSATLPPDTVYHQTILRR